jgi:hypothetical protein
VWQESIPGMAKKLKVIFKKLSKNMKMKEKPLSVWVSKF